MAAGGRKKGRIKKLLFSVLALCAAAAYPLKEQLFLEEETAAETASDFSEGSELTVHYLDIGQGDAALIQCGDAAMLIDAGNNNKGTQVQAYLESQGIEQLDYVIGTHPDADHIGGLDVILYKFDCGTVIMPEFEKDTKTYEDVIQTMKQKNYKLTYPTLGESYSLGSASFTIVAPAGEDYGDNGNDYSVGILLEHGENRFLFTGDAEEDAEQDMLASGLNLSADVFKAAHHGSSTANTEEFLEEVDPDYVVISCGEDNSYGHPHAEVLNRLRERGIEVFRTDEEGTIVASSDGYEITFNVPPSESWKAGEPSGSRGE